MLALIATTGITSVLGVGYWWLAAHRASLASVGNGSAAVSAMTLAGTLGMAGLNTALIPRLARRPDGDRVAAAGLSKAGGLLAAGLGAAAGISALLACCWVAVAAADPRLAPYLGGGEAGSLFIVGPLFIVGAALTGAGLVLDEAVLGLLGGGPQLWRNATFAVSKLAVLAALTTVWHDELGTPLLTAWVAGTALSLLVAAAALHRRGVRLATRPHWGALRGLARASAVNTWLNNSLIAPVQLAPILVTSLLGARDGGAFYVAATVLSVVTLLSFHFTTALYAAGTHDPGALAAKLRFTLRVSLLGGLAGVPLTILAAHPLLRAFGEQYADRAALPLEVMIAGYFGTALKNHYVALCRLQDRVTRGAAFGTVSCGLRLAAVTAGALAGGLNGVAIALLVVMCAEGAYALPAIRAALRAGHPPTRRPLARPALAGPVKGQQLS